MGTRARSSTPDLFSSALTGEAHSRSSESSGSSPAIIHKTRSAIPSHHVLPTDLPNAVRDLDDQELDQLTSAVIAEQKRRGNLCLRKTAWWGWEDSNFEPNDYQPPAQSQRRTEPACGDFSWLAKCPKGGVSWVTGLTIIPTIKDFDCRSMGDRNVNVSE